MSHEPIIGGVGMAVVADKSEILYPKGGQVGDVLLLTKPLGTQIAVNIEEWKNKKLSQQMDKCGDVSNSFNLALESMATLSK